jgi:hypothetical protein
MTLLNFKIYPPVKISLLYIVTSEIDKFYNLFKGFHDKLSII